MSSDGKDYSIVGSGRGDMMKLRRLDALTTQSTEKRDSKVTITALQRVSPDGRTLTVGNLRGRCRRVGCSAAR